MFHLISKHPRSIYPKSENQYFFIILNTRKLFHLIKTPRSNISDTRGSVSSDIHTPSSNISNTRKSVSYDIQTPRSNISKTGRSVSFDIQTPRSNILNRKRSVLSDSQHRQVYIQTRLFGPSTNKRTWNKLVNQIFRD